jgi:hypothetical protein
MKLTIPTPAMVVAMLALFVALGGTAVATTSTLITGRQIKNSSITGADVKNKSLSPIDFRGSVRGAQGAAGPPGPVGPQGLQGPAGDKGDKGDNGDKGDTGDAGTAVAYARINGIGAIGGPSKGITNAMITHPAEGVYCFRNLPAGTRIALVSADNANSNDTIASVLTTTSASVVPCDAGAGDRVRVRTYDVSLAALANREFVIWFED